MTILQLFLLICIIILYYATRRGWRPSESKYRINDAGSYFDNDRKNASTLANKHAGTFSDRTEGEPDSDAWVNSSSRGMSLPAFPIGRPAQAKAEQSPGNVIRDDTIR